MITYLPWAMRLESCDAGDQSAWLNQVVLSDYEFVDAATGHLNCNQVGLSDSTFVDGILVNKGENQSKVECGILWFDLN